MKPFIAENEVLLMFDQTRTGIRYVGESTSIGRSYTLDMLLDEPCGTCFRIVKMNTETLSSEDVTELFAGAWLKRFADEQEKAGFEVERSDERLMPDYVKASAAWADMIEEIEMSQPIDTPPRRYNSLSLDSYPVRGANLEVSA